MNDISIVLCGEAGQGIQTVEQLFTHIVRKGGLHVFSTKEYMSRVRGGSNSTQIRIAPTPVHAYVERIDVLISLSKHAISHVHKRITEETVIIGEKNDLKNTEKYYPIEISFSNIAESIGNRIFSNTIAVGLLSSLCNVDKKILHSEIPLFFSTKPDEIIQNNIIAVEKGYALGQGIKDQGKITVAFASDSIKKTDMLINGTQAIGLGAIAGGCNFISSYPMSPSTGVLTFLSTHADEFEIIVEQAEDEIAAINMVLGSWYAGARAMVTTSGGGYALMTEGISLAGMIESPVVIHLAQKTWSGNRASNTYRTSRC
jgi:2-oxoglutarate ferredoxin oxidoreductase subunit alpha